MLPYWNSLSDLAARKGSAGKTPAEVDQGRGRTSHWPAIVERMQEYCPPASAATLSKSAEPGIRGLRGTANPSRPSKVSWPESTLTGCSSLSHTADAPRVTAAKNPGATELVAGVEPTTAARVDGSGRAPGEPQYVGEDHSPNHHCGGGV